MKKIIAIILAIALIVTIMPLTTHNVSATSTYSIRYINALPTPKNPVYYSLPGGGSGGPSTQYVERNTYFYLSSKIPVRSGYTFLYWRTLGGDIYQPGQRCYYTSILHLYAVWKAKTTYTPPSIPSTKTYYVRYYANGGGGSPSTQTKRHGVSLRLSTVVPTKTGHVFRGWRIEANGSNSLYWPGENYSKNEDVDFYAVWAKSYSIKYMAMGGINAPAEQVKIHGTTLTLSTVEPTRKGYKFVGWSSYHWSDDDLYLAGASYTDNRSITLYAVWKEEAKKNIKKATIVVKNQSYSGKAIKPVVTVKNGDKELTNGTDYLVTYSNNKNIGKAKVTIKGKGKYVGTKIVHFKINPKANQINKLTKAKKAFTVRWSKVNGVTGYQVSYKEVGTSKWKNTTVSSVKKSSVKIGKLKAKKNYQVRVRTYKTVNKVKFYSTWSPIKTVKTK